MPHYITSEKKSLLYLLVAILLFSSSCRTTKYVEDNEYLLKKIELKGEGRKINKEELSSYVKQKPNKKVLGLKFHLGVYSLSKKGKENWINRVLRTIGEPPVIYDPFLTQKTVDQLELYLRGKGYYNAVVTDSLELDKKKATVVYYIRKNDPYVLHNINYAFEDTTLRSLVLSDTTASVLHRGELFDVDLLSSERERIATIPPEPGVLLLLKRIYLL